MPEDKQRLACDVLGIAYEHSAAFAAEARRQALAVARSPQAKEDQDFIDAVSDWSGS
ncbi:MAG: antitoxin MazE-like protein [Stellaceae bacterium]